MRTHARRMTAYHRNNRGHRAQLPTRSREDAKMTQEELDKVSWKFARAAVIVETRSIWVQPHQLGLTVDATEVLIHKDDDTSGFDSEESD